MSDSSSVGQAPHFVLTPALVRIMAVATGLAVASDYYAQPLLPAIARDMGMSATSAGAIVTIAQLGYALGLLLIVPLGDVFEQRRLVVILAVLTAVGLLLTALAPCMALVFLGTALAGLCSALAQVLLPLAATLAEPEKRGRVIGTIMSGLLLGVLLARTVAGGLTLLGSWRSIYGVGALAMLALALILARCLPRYHQPLALSYPRLLLSVLSLFRSEPTLRLRAALGAISFAAFSVLWTSMAFLLAAPPFCLSAAAIGLFGLAGAAGVLAASLAGRLTDRGQGAVATRLGLLLLLASWLPLFLAPHSLVLLILGILLLDVAALTLHVSNQGAIYRIRPDARNRLTAAYMTCYFLGGAIGSLASATAYELAGWKGVALVGAAISLAGVLLWERAGNPQAERNQRPAAVADRG